MSAALGRAGDIASLSPSDVSAFEQRLEQARVARRQVIEHLDDARIVATLADAARSWLDPREPLRLRTIEGLATLSGQHPGMLGAGIDMIFAAIDRDSVTGLLRSEGGANEIQRRYGPEAVFYALAGNVPGQGVPPIVVSLLARSVAVIRDSARQPYLTAAFRESIACREPMLAAMIVPVFWPSAHPSSAERTLERSVIESARRISLFGSDATLSALASRYAADARHRVELHATRMSVGIVDESADLKAAAEAFARDAVMYEGRGCLNPHVLVVEGASSRARDFCALLAGCLAQLEAEWPRARGTLEEESARRAYVDAAEIAALAEPERSSTRVGARGAWCIRGGGNEAIGLGPGLRCVRVIPTPHRDATLTLLARATTPFAAVGLASASAAVLATLEPQVTGLGATLVCLAGRMQAPPIDWRQDGVSRLAELLETPQ